MRRLRAFTLVEMLVVVAIIALLVGILLPALAAARASAEQGKNGAHLRGIHQEMLIYSQNNRKYLPGLVQSRLIQTAGTWNTGTTARDGSFASSRLWILLKNGFAGPDLIISPAEESPNKYGTGQMTSAMFSYALLGIARPTTDPAGDLYRAMEWKDGANARAVMMSDRNTGSSDVDTVVQSLWTTGGGAANWAGNVVWGDSHIEYIKNSLNVSTKYTDYTINSDNLFISASTGTPARTEPVPTPASTYRTSGNAFMIFN